MADESPSTPAAEPESRSLDIVIRVVHAKGQINAECLPTLHDFLIDELPRAAFHATRAMNNAIQQAIDDFYAGRI